MNLCGFNGYGKTEIVSLTEEWIIGRNAKRDRAILLSRFIDGLTYEQIAEVYGLSVSQVKRIVYSGEQIIFRHMRQGGVTGSGRQDDTSWA